MPPSGTVIANLDNVVFSKGYMYGTIQGHTADAIAFGALQDVEFTHTFDTVDLNGPESLSPVATGIGGENLSGTFSNGVIHPEQLVMLLGGTEVVNGAYTDYVKLVEQEPLPFDLHFESGVTGLDDLDLVLYRCLCPSWSIRAGNRQFMIGSSSFRVYGQAAADGGVLFKLIKPGNLTSSS